MLFQQHSTVVLPLRSMSDCEQRSVTRFLTAKNTSEVEIHRQLLSVYGEEMISVQHVREVGRNFGLMPGLHSHLRYSPRLSARCEWDKYARMQIFALWCGNYKTKLKHSHFFWLGTDLLTCLRELRDETRSGRKSGRWDKCTLHIFVLILSHAVWTRMWTKNNDTVESWYRSFFWKLYTEFYACGISKLVSWYDKCLNINGNYVEKL